MNKKYKKAYEAIQEALNSSLSNSSSKWTRAITEDAQDFIEALELENEGSAYEILKERINQKASFRSWLEKKLLAGASTWEAYSWGGCSRIYEEDIARHYCTPSELKRFKNGRKHPSFTRGWLDVQSKALYQAFLVLARVVEDVARNFQF